LALLLGSVEVIKTLLELGSNPNIANAFDGNHPLVYLARLRSEENSKTPLLAEILLNGGSDPLHEVRYQADNARRLDATQTPSFHETPLLCAGRSSRTKKKFSSIFYLVRFQNEDVLRKMIDHGADINALNPETGTSPLMLAAALGYLNICNILLDAGAEINACDHAGYTPLHLAVQGYGEQIPVIETLLKRGADPSAVNEDGFTPAMIAKRLENDACFKILDSHTEEKIEPPAYEIASAKEENKQQTIFSFA
jgi:ankyrin repeat protein